jgi:GT2 family glycosyltransferase
MHCSTIIVSYNTFPLTEAAVRSALRAADNLEHEIIVIDNASPDGSGARLASAFPRDTFKNIHVIQNESNVGFARANNQGARIAQGDVLFFLNPDTVVRDHAIWILHNFIMTHPEAGAVGPHVVNPDGTDQSSTARFLTAREIIRHHLPITSLLRGQDRRQGPVPETTSRADIVNGCALAIRRDAFDEVGGWDESYFMYAEETELCYSTVRRGYANYFVRESQIVHYGGASSLENYAAQQVVQKRSGLKFLRRHHSPSLVRLNRMAGILGFGGRIVIFGLLSRLRPARRSDYRRRGEAASTVFRWFLREYS